MTHYDSKNDVKEEFCGACAIIPLAFAGAGATAYGGSRGSAKRKRQIIFWTGIISLILSVMLIAYLIKKTNCDDCR
jgi:hypothetical protein